MPDSSAIYKKRWWQRIIDARRRYFFEHIRERESISDLSVRQVLKWMNEDLVYTATWTINVLLQLRAYGFAIQKEYGVSLGRQFLQMMYLTFVVRTTPGNYRSHQLFKPDNWKNVDELAYLHSSSQRELLKVSLPDEMDLFLNKFSFYEFCRLHNIFTPTVTAVFQKGKVVYPRNKQLNLPAENLFIKNLSGQMGWGAKKLHFKNGVFRDREGVKYDSGDVIGYLKDYSLKNSDVILQKVVSNHESWKKFTPGGLSTCRIVTVRQPEHESVLPLFAALRMPGKGSDTDNFSGGGSVSRVDIKTGGLGKVICSLPVNGAFEFSHNPFTGEKIESTVIPFWNELLDFTLGLHRKVRSPIVGWDVCMSDKGCCVLEGSLVWASASYECPHQKPLKETEYPVLFEQWMEKFTLIHE